MAAFASGADWSFDSIKETVQTADDAHTPEMQSQQNDAAGPKPALFDTTSTPTPPAGTTENARPRTGSHNTHEQSQPRNARWSPRQCRICLEIVQPTVEINELPLPEAIRPKPRVTYVSEEGGRLLKPCKCKGSQRYVHEQCLQQWRLADVSQKRNYYECPTCRYRYKLQRLTWAAYISSTASQIALTLVILFLTMFVLGFVADPIINMYLFDPYYTITTRGGPTGSLIFEDEAAGWAEHFAKGLASLGLIGFAKLLFTVSPWQIFRGNFGGGGGGRAGGTGRDRINQATWLLILIGVVTFLIAVWRGVRAWARKTLEAAGEQVLDVPGGTDDDIDDADEYKEQ